MERPGPNTGLCDSSSRFPSRPVLLGDDPEGAAVSCTMTCRSNAVGRGGDRSRSKRGGGYSFCHGHPSGVLQQQQGESSAGPEDARPPGFPSVDELKELNRKIHDDAGTPERSKLDQPSPLKTCLERARGAYVDTPDGVIQTAALLAHGIAHAQAFVDGNRRTAYFATLSFLQANRFRGLSPMDGDDHLLARYLNQVVESRGGTPPDPEKFASLFRRRLRRREGPG